MTTRNSHAHIATQDWQYSQAFFERLHNQAAQQRTANSGNKPAIDSAQSRKALIAALERQLLVAALENRGGEMTHPPDCEDPDADFWTQIEIPTSEALRSAEIRQATDIECDHLLSIILAAKFYNRAGDDAESDRILKGAYLHFSSALGPLRRELKELRKSPRTQGELALRAELAARDHFATLPTANGEGGAK